MAVERPGIVVRIVVRRKGEIVPVVLARASPVIDLRGGAARGVVVGNRQAARRQAVVVVAGADVRGYDGRADELVGAGKHLPIRHAGKVELVEEACLLDVWQEVDENASPVLLGGGVGLRWGGRRVAAAPIRAGREGGPCTPQRPARRRRSGADCWCTASAGRPPGAPCTAGSINPTRMPMIVITTSSSTRVNPQVRCPDLVNPTMEPLSIRSHCAPPIVIYADLSHWQWAWSQSRPVRRSILPARPPARLSPMWIFGARLPCSFA